MKSKENQEEIPKNSSTGTNVFTINNNNVSLKIKLKMNLLRNINHSVCEWCYNIPLEDLVYKKIIGLVGIDLIELRDGCFKKT